MINGLQVSLYLVDPWVLAYNAFARWQPYNLQHTGDTEGTGDRYIPHERLIPSYLHTHQPIPMHLHVDPAGLLSLV